MKPVIIIAIVFVLLIPLPVFAQYLIPDWIKNTAKWWSEDKISDSEFINSIEFLVNNKIIVIQIQENSDVETTEKIPSWIKLNAGW